MRRNFLWRLDFAIFLHAPEFSLASGLGHIFNSVLYIYFHNILNLFLHALEFSLAPGLGHILYAPEFSPAPLFFMCLYILQVSIFYIFYSLHVSNIFHVPFFMLIIANHCVVYIP